jgi:hypothetical protein
MLKLGHCMTMLPYAFSQAELSQTINQARLTAARQKFPGLNVLKEQYYEVGRHLVMATSAAFRELNRNVELLQRLQLGLREETLDEAGLNDAGFSVQRFGEHGYFGLQLKRDPQGAEAGRFESAYEGEPDRAGLPEDPRFARQFFRMFGIDVVNPETLKSSEAVRNLHLLIQFAIRDQDYASTRRLVIEPGSYNNIFSLGNGDYVISQSLLHKHFRAGTWPQVVQLPLVGGAINAGRMPALAETTGLFGQPELMSRLLLITPAAFFALSRDEALLDRLNERLQRTGSLDLKALREASHFVSDQRFGDRYLGLCYNYPEELDLYRASVDALADSREAGDIAVFFRYQDVLVKEADKLSPTDWRNLRYQYERENDSIASVAIRNQGAHIYSSRGDDSLDVTYSRQKLEQLRRNVN